MRIVFLILIGILFSCKEPKPLVRTSLNDVVLLPLPNTIDHKEYGFLFDQETSIQISDSALLMPLAKKVKRYLSAGSFPLEIGSTGDLKENSIYLRLVSKDSIENEEGYVLDIHSEKISIAGSDPQGIFRGMQTFKQLLPVNFLAKAKSIDSLVLPGMSIVDEPAYSYRGMMLDVARHFFTVEQVKRLIDQMVFYKLNRLHLHLSDDQGWRIEIKSWPKLTEIGGSTAVGGGSGGFYTQEDYKAIVAYAAEHFITIIPEIDMPGHTNAALAAYPELNCNGKSPKLYTGMRVGFSSLCVDKELTYTFINDVIGELAAMTPGEYIHLGGDESDATSQKDYNKFLKRAFQIVKMHDKKVMGWEDIQSAGVTNDMILQHWTSEKVALKGLEQGAQMILSPAKKTYLDMKYTEDSKLGLTWAGYVEVDSAYLWQPDKIFGDQYKDQIVGIESPLWSETISTSEDIEYLAFPRVIGHAEIGWNGKPKSWNSYKNRLLLHYKILEGLKMNFYESPRLDDAIKQ